MPGMDGLTCLGQIMIESPRPVVMISALTEAGAEATLEAIELGAVDFIAKPSGTVSLEIDRLRPLLVEKVRAAANVRIRRTLRLTERIRHQFRGAGVLPRPAPAATAAYGGKPSRPVAGPGTDWNLDRRARRRSTSCCRSLPLGFPWPVLVAQHMPAGFTGAFAKRLDRQCELQVVEVNRPMPLQAGIVYIGRGDADVIVAPRAAGMIAMSVPAQRDYPWHPSVERMVTSALDHYDAAQLIGVLMTGMGRDGADAMTRLRQRRRAHHCRGGIERDRVGHARRTGEEWRGRAGPCRSRRSRQAIVEMVGAHAVR